MAVRLKKFAPTEPTKTKEPKQKIKTKGRRRLSEKEWLEHYLAPLKGAMITDIEIKEENGQLWPVLRVIKFKEEERFIEISRDAEGNGPGFIFGLPNVQDPEIVDYDA